MEINDLRDFGSVGTFPKTGSRVVFKQALGFLVSFHALPQKYS
jgi:hypothetical protein